MKKIYGFAALSAAMLLASCSNNDEPIMGGEAGPSVAATTGYISLTLMDAQGTRADDDYEHVFSTGSEAESHISKGCVICFTSDKKFAWVADLDNTSFTYNPTPGSTNIESYKEAQIQVKEMSSNKITDAIIVLNMSASDLGLTNPTVAADGSITTNTGSMVDQTVTTIRQKLADFGTGKYTKGNFVMSNAVYNETKKDASDNDVTAPNYTVPVSTYSDMAEAGNKKVTVYVERLASKLTYAVNKVNNTASFTNNGIYSTTDQTYNFNGTDITEAKKLSITVTGIGFANAALRSYLVKDLGTNPNFTGFKTTPKKFNWNDPTNFRSHWALVADVNEDKTYWDNAPTDAATKNAGKLIFETYKSWNGLTTQNFDITSASGYKYVQENTNADAPTAILISAYVGIDADDDGQLDDIYRAVVNGKYYTNDKIKDAYLGYLIGDKYLKKVHNNETNKDEYKSLEASDLILVQSKDIASTITCPRDDYSGYVQIDPTKVTTVYKDAATVEAIAATGTPVANVNKALVEATIDSETTVKNDDGTDKKDSNDKLVYVQLHKYRVYKWAGGACYYYKNIAADQVGKDGVVRNHIYDLTLNGVKGMGVPVWDPTKKIIPETPDPVDPKEPTDVYINATINVLSWTYYTQGVIFE